MEIAAFCFIGMNKSAYILCTFLDVNISVYFCLVKQGKLHGASGKMFLLSNVTFYLNTAQFFQIY